MKSLLVILLLALAAYSATGTCITKNYDDSWGEHYRTYRTESKICMVGADTAFVAHYYNSGELWYVSMKMIGEIEDVPDCVVRNGFKDCHATTLQYGSNVMVIRVRGKYDVYEFVVNKTADGHKCSSVAQCKKLNSGVR